MIAVPRPATGGAHLADALLAHGVRLAFCVPGESYLALLDALHDRRDGLQVVACRHEHGASVMAEAYGKLTGRPGVCLVTRGPGACNAAIGVHTAFQDSTPLVVIVGQVPRSFLGREAFQEIDQVRFWTTLAKAAWQVTDGARIADAVVRAFHVALSGRPGPVVLIMPEDVLEEEVAAPAATPQPVSQAPFDPGLLERFRRMLGDAERPLVVVGGSGWTAEARVDLEAFVAGNALPVACTFRRLDVLDGGHPSFIGELGIAPDPALVARARAADLVIALGTRLGEVPTQGYTLFQGGQEGPAIVHVHPDPAEMGRVYRPALAIASTIPPFIAAARRLAAVGGERWRTWAEDSRREYLASRRPSPCAGPLDLALVMADVDRHLPADAVVTVDAGNFSGWPQRFLRFGGARRFLGPANGAMGYGVPAAVAAKIAEPQRTVLACVGDGGFGMTGQELATARSAGAAPVILVFNNAMFGTIRMHQERTYPGRVIATDLANPDFAALAHAFGCHGETVSATADFAPAFARALAAGRAAVIDLRMDREQITTRTTLSALRRGAHAVRTG